MEYKKAKTCYQPCRHAVTAALPLQLCMQRLVQCAVVMSLPVMQLYDIITPANGCVRIIYTYIYT